MIDASNPVSTKFPLFDRESPPPVMVGSIRASSLNELISEISVFVLIV